jgi:hypothetical protein
MSHGTKQHIPTFSTSFHPNLCSTLQNLPIPSCGCQLQFKLHLLLPPNGHDALDQRPSDLLQLHMRLAVVVVEVHVFLCREDAFDRQVPALRTLVFACCAGGEGEDVRFAVLRNQSVRREKGGVLRGGVVPGDRRRWAKTYPQGRGCQDFVLL